MTTRSQVPDKRLSLNTVRYAVLSRRFTFEPRNNPWVVIYPEAGLIYNRIKKSGNTSIRYYLNEILGGGAGRPVTSVIGPMGQSAELIRQMDHFLTFTIFRNPYSRCLSAFLQKMGAGKKKYRRFPGFGNPTPAGFRAFVEYLEQGGLHANRHWWPQVDLLFWPPDSYDYVGQLENLNTELGGILSRRGITPPPSLDLTEPHPVEQGLKDKITGSGEKVAAFYTEDLFERVHTLYSRDFELGGYSKV